MQKLSSVILFLILSVSWTVGQNSPHGNLQMDCSECHTSSSWKIPSGSSLFNHETTGFSLMGQHKQVDCKQCHSSLKFSKTRSECFTCHKDIHKNSVGQQCENCHTPQSWVIKNVNELHQKSRFPLLGNHATADCSQCHNLYRDLNFEPLGVKCFDCHKQNFNSAKTPDHIAAQFSTNCEDCHNFVDKRWGFASFGHDFFPLKGGHAINNCLDCHEVGNYKGLSRDCYTCHQTDFENTKEPNHVSSQFSHDCTECHTTNPGWKPATFDHSKTKFPITGAHTQVANCADCHKTGYVNTLTDCFSCHKTDYDNTKNPNHSQVNFQTTCEDCHTTKAWKPANFDHDNKFFPIYSGEHKGEWNNCSDCHTNSSNYADFTCINCHEHNQSKMNSEHNGVNGYVYQSQACYHCHPNGKGDGAFNHSTTQFPLTGQHVTTNCADCHINNTYANTSMLCESCHLTAFTSSVNPNHQQVGISTDCQTCHNSTGWKPSAFNHEAKFQLLGVHATTDCANCHKGQTTGTSQICNDCHNQNFVSSVNPNHQQVGISTDCQACHNSAAWIPSSFNHGSTTFILTGAHTSTDCSNCHKGVTTGTSSDCYSCHKTNFESTTNPNHVSGNFPTTCEVCHTTQPGWKPATFTNHDQFYVIQGAHAAFKNDCQKCHSSGYTNTPNTCFGCHEAKYNATTNPNHKTAAFPTDCESCHSQNAWKPATFDHDGKYFPIYSGKHQGEWNTCSDCHTSSADYRIFSCINCHEHNNKANVDDDHRGVNGYSYVSSECYRCHPNGKGDGLKAIRLKRIEN